MRTVVDGGGGGYAPSFPLPHYEGKAGPTIDAGNSATAQHAPLSGLQTDLTSRARTAAGSTDGLLVGPVLRAPAVPHSKAAIWPRPPCWPAA